MMMNKKQKNILIFATGSLSLILLLLCLFITSNGHRYRSAVSAYLIGDHARAIEILNTTSERYQALPKAQHLRSYCLFELAQEASSSGENATVLKHLSGIYPIFEKAEEVAALATATSNEIVRLEREERDRHERESLERERKRLEEARLAKKREAMIFIRLVRECEGYHSGSGVGYGPAYLIDQFLKEIGFAANAVEISILDGHPNADDLSKYRWEMGMFEDELIVERRIKVSDPNASMRFTYTTTTNRVRIAEPPESMIWVHARCRVNNFMKDMYQQWPERRKMELEDAAKKVVRSHIEKTVDGAPFVAFLLWVDGDD